ncbi:GntR family transcriptional regulator [Polynucleobacter sp. AM-25C3]|jgi:DNA-binding GntR family transcriptional regulator|uniref:GntR family transcriptional regulator n=1 Tax=Polynucleobacter sp. AM-25C3 TaxID=1855569 RepID=UPI001C0C2E5A|nr:GntR family transcriptional regulator [Polynucleobacter sp. AM-25C3]MBU3602756.1 GntR family transcriptional regulator [Polynucleobacter sp. AM-25C3]
MPGELISEGNLAKIVNVSSTPLRQALQQLQHGGFIKAIPKIGWQIAPLDFDKLDEMYGFRILIELNAVKALCNTNRDDQIFKDLQKIWLTPKSKRSFNTLDIGILDEQFHSSLVKASGNEEMLKTHSEITERIKIVRRLDFTKSDRINSTYDEHGQIIKAILAGRVAEAQRLLKAHIEQSKIEVRKITLGMLQDARKQATG